MELDLKTFIADELGFTSIKIAIISVLWIFVFVAMVIDLISGLRKAKKAGVATSSELLKRSTNKVIKNYSALAFMLMFDMLFFWVSSYFKATELSYFPLPTIAMAMFEIYVEYRSFRENISEKLRSKDMEALKELLELTKMIKDEDARNLLRKISENKEQ